MGDSVNPPRRTYDNAGRRAQAEARREAILRAGHDLLVAQGYGATTMAAVARTAGVSVETVYKGFGTKPDLVRQVLEVAVVGDDEPMALIERSDMQAALHAGSGAAILGAFADASMAILDRSGPLLVAILVAGRAGEPDLREIASVANQQRYDDLRKIVDAVAATGDLDPSLDVVRATDIVWTIGSPEVHQQLTADRGWSRDEYHAWLIATLEAQLLRRRGSTPAR